MDMDFVVSGPLDRRSRLVPGSCPSTRTFALRFLQTSPRGDSPCVVTNPSPPSGWVEDFHLQATEHAQHTTNPLRGTKPRRQGSGQGENCCRWRTATAIVAAMAGPLRRTGIPVLGQIPWGAHICMFYETKQDLVDAHVDYFRTGLQDNEFSLWAISEPITEQEARDALAQGIPEFERHLRDGRIELLPGREWYMKG